MIPSALAKTLALLLVTSSSLALTKETIQLAAEQIRYEYKSNSVFYSGNVIVTQGLTQLTADTVTVYYNAHHKINKIIAIGNPAKYYTVIHKNRDKLTASGQQIWYYPLQENVVLKDQANVIYNKSTFSGPTITYDIKQERIVSRPSQMNRAMLVLEPIKNLLTTKHE